LEYGTFSLADIEVDSRVATIPMIRSQILLQGQRLFKRCRDDALFMWDVAAAIDKITEFEDSLARAPEHPATAPSL
jgi:hypothetical protein